MTKTTYDCQNCNHHWAAEVFQESCPACGSYAVMTTDEWSLEDSLEEAKHTEIEKHEEN